ncbi:MAG: class I SAM-dependent methyltransferase [Myxococcota bacterium]
MNKHPRSDVAVNKLAYNDVESIRSYEKDRFSGLLGRRRDARERRASHAAIQQFTRDSTVLDCPCGNGRWFERLGFRAGKIIARDVAPEMVKAAAERAVLGVEIDTGVDDAEHLELADDAVDHVWCFALMKHLPDDMKRRVLREFARVASSRIAVSFCVTNPVSQAVWRARGSRGYPNTEEELTAICASADLSIGALYSVSLPVVGLETIAVLERR